MLSMLLVKTYIIAVAYGFDQVLLDPEMKHLHSFWSLKVTTELTEMPESEILQGMEELGFFYRNPPIKQGRASAEELERMRLERMREAKLTIQGDTHFLWVTFKEEKTYSFLFYAVENRLKVLLYAPGSADAEKVEVVIAKARQLGAR